MELLALLVGTTVFSAIALKVFGAATVAMATGLTTFAAISLNETVIPVLLAVLSSGFIFGLFKIMPERRSILVQASENAVKVVNDAIGTLQRELTEARQEIARLEGELTSARTDRDRFSSELLNLRSKVTRLETQLEMYERIRGASQVTTRNQGERRVRQRPYRGPDKRYSVHNYDQEYDNG